MSETLSRPSRRIATQVDCTAHWGGDRTGKRFRCHMCGHRFEIGDGFRKIDTSTTVYTHEGLCYALPSPLVCDTCYGDGETFMRRWTQQCIEFRKRFWSFV